MVNILDKLIVDRYAPSIYFYAFWIGVYELFLASIAVGIVSIHGLESSPFLGGMLTGAIRSVSLLFLLSALKRGQVARVVPIWYLYPLMVSPMAIVFLDESLPPLAWGGIPLAVLGGVLVSWQGGADGRIFGNPATILLALAAAVTFATSIALSKYFLEGDTFWQFYSASRLGFGLGMLGVIIVPDVRRRGLGMVSNGRFHGPRRPSGRAGHRRHHSQFHRHHPGPCVRGRGHRLNTACFGLPLFTGAGQHFACHIWKLDNQAHRWSPISGHCRHHRGRRPHLLLHQVTDRYFQDPSGKAGRLAGSTSWGCASVIPSWPLTPNLSNDVERDIPQTGHWRMCVSPISDRRCG